MAVMFKDKGKGTTAKPASGRAAKSAGEAGQGASSRLPRPGVADYIAGEAKDFVADLSPYLPAELVGGSVPHIAGTEEEAVWNAACQACGTERVHYVFTVQDGRCWYLASPSSSLASNPDSWCPLAAALPGNSEYWDRETVYLYEQEGMASALRWDHETGRMQVFIGAARTLLPRIQSMDANFVTLNPEVAKVEPWRNRQLHTEKLSRATVKTLLFFGLGINMIALLVLFIQSTMTGFVQRDLETVRTQTERLSSDLMLNAYNALQSDSIRHMVRVQALLDELSKIDGTLVKYEVDRNRVTWEALVPQSFSDCSGVLGRCEMLGLEPDRRVRIRGSR